MTDARKVRNAWPKLQVALDVLTIEDAVRIAKEAHRAGVEWVEAGTPLIKSEGMESVRVLKAKVPEATVVADMKTLDAGAMEMEMALKAGADVVSVSGLSDNSTIRDSAKVKNRYGRAMMVDLLQVTAPAKRAREVESLGADIVCMHTGVDVQKATGTSMKIGPELSELTRTLNIPVATAGGVNPTLAPRLVEAGVRILIVGGWITGSEDPYRAALAVVSSLRGVGVETG